MPTYDYVCDACDHKFEEFQSMTEAPLTKCPECGKKKLRRLFGTGAAVLFKGSGFYETDYRSDSYRSAAKAEQDKAKPAETPRSDANGSAKAEGGAGDAGSAARPSGKSSKSGA